jgi:hypothetical protein
MQELNFAEIDSVNGASTGGTVVVAAAVVIGAAVGVIAAPAVGATVAVGAVAGAASAGIHALVTWNALND